MSRHTDRVRQLTDQLLAAGIRVERQEVADYIAATENRIANAQGIIEAFLTKIDPHGFASEKKFDIFEQMKLQRRTQEKRQIICPPRPYCPDEMAGERGHYGCQWETLEEFSKRTGLTLAQIHAMSDDEIKTLPVVPEGFYTDRECRLARDYQAQKTAIRFSLSQQIVEGHPTFYECGVVSVDKAKAILLRMQDPAWDLGRERRGEYTAASCR